MGNMIQLNSVHKSYGKVKALESVNLKIGKGKVIGLLGPNGSGKTTMIKILAGMIKNYKGQVLINGQKWHYKTKSIISYLPDIMIFDRWKTVDDLEKFYDEMFEDFQPLKFRHLISEFGLEDRTYFKKLSKGNKEKLQLAFVLARDASVYLFDEPIGGVDPAVREIILDTIMKFKKTDATVILSTHQIYDVENLFDEVIFLKNGKVLFHQNTKTLIRNNNMSLLNIFKKVFRNVS